MPTYKPNAIVNSGSKRRVRLKESNRIVSEAIEQIINNENLSQQRRKQLAYAKPSLIKNFYENFDSAKDLEQAEVAKSILNYLSHIENFISVRGTYPHRRLRKMRPETALIRGIKICCSKYPGIFPFCSRKC